jgi:YidC/Oxa1 family membrane protein insertase
MEKNTIIAFALAFLVLILWSFFFSHKKEQPLPVKEPARKEAKMTAPKLAERSVLKPSTPSDSSDLIVRTGQAQVSKKEIRVDTPLYRIVFSNEGATIKSYKLKEYHLTTDPDSPLIDLVSHKDDSEAFLSAYFDDPSLPDDEKIVYHASDDTLSLSPGSPPRDLTFVYNGPNGISRTHTYRFYPDRYDIELSVSLANTPNQRWVEI